MPINHYLERENEDDNNSNLVSGTNKTAYTSQKHRFSKSKKLPGVNSAQVVKMQDSYRKRFLMRQLPYRLPTICRCKSGEWYIQYHYERPDAPGKFKPFKVKDGLNRVHDPIEKELYARRLVQEITHHLEVKNYNPFTGKLKRAQQAIAEIEANEAPKNWIITEAIEKFKAFVLKQNYSQRTINTYNNYLSNLTNYLKDNPDKNIEACEFSEIDLMAFLDVESNQLDWSARTYNNYIGFYHLFFNRCLKLEKQVKRKITYNFDIDGVDAKKTTPQKNKAYTPVLVNLIKKELAKPGYENLRDYVEWIFLSLMRPAEIQELQVKDIDEHNRQIRIIGKTGDRIIPISDQLLRLINKRGVMKLGHNNYVFGMAGKPGPNRMSKNFFPEKYVEIKKTLHLETNYTIYAFKHTAVIQMITAGFSDEEVMMLSGHKTKEAFNAYKRDLVIDTSHVMKGSAIEF